MEPLDPRKTNFKDTFDLLAALPDMGKLRWNSPGHRSWRDASAGALSEYFLGDRGLAGLWAEALDRFCAFWEALNKASILRIYGSGFARHLVVYGLLGRDPMAFIVRKNQLRRILILGETGTGKEAMADVVARATLEQDLLNPRGFARLSAAEFTDTLLQSELFGYKKGSHTGAKADYPGILGNLPDGGLLFLDELGEASPRFQAELLRVLQTGEYRPVGSSRPAQREFHFIAATNEDESALAAGRVLRKDLYYRIAQHVITMPPLRTLVAVEEAAHRVFKALLEHEISRFLGGRTHARAIQPDSKAAEPGPDDEAVLLSRLCGKYLAEFGFVPSRLQDVMSGYSWPGNLRECSNLLRRILSDGPDSVEEHCLAVRRQKVMAVDLPEPVKPGLPLKEALSDFERRAYMSAAAGCCTYDEVARALGVTRQTASRRMAALGIDLARKSTPEDAGSSAAPGAR
jgi:hypothetical protein